MLLTTKLLGGRTAMKAMRGAKKRFRQGVATAMNKSAYDARDEVIEEMKRIIDRPTPFTVNKKSVFVRRAFPNRLRVIVEMGRKQASYLKWMVYGGTRKGKLWIPFKHLQLNRYGNKPKGWHKARPDRFKATIKGVYGFWERDGRNVRLLAGREQKAQYEAKIPYHKIVAKAYFKNFPRQFKKVMVRL